MIYCSRSEILIGVEVVITDKDMGDSNVFRDEMPHIDLQICLFHALIDNMGITSGERKTVLQKKRSLPLHTARQTTIANIKNFGKYPIMID